jgi:hypothetical protein
VQVVRAGGGPGEDEPIVVSGDYNIERHIWSELPGTLETA